MELKPVMKLKDVIIYGIEFAECVCGHQGIIGCVNREQELLHFSKEHPVEFRMVENSDEDELRVTVKGRLVIDSIEYDSRPVA